MEWDASEGASGVKSLRQIKYADHKSDFRTVLGDAGFAKKEVNKRQRGRGTNTFFYFYISIVYN